MIYSDDPFHSCQALFHSHHNSLKVTFIVYDLLLARIIVVVVPYFISLSASTYMPTKNATGFSHSTRLSRRNLSRPALGSHAMLALRSQNMKLWISFYADSLFYCRHSAPANCLQFIRIVAASPCPDAYVCLE